MLVRGIWDGLLFALVNLHCKLWFDYKEERTALEPNVQRPFNDILYLLSLSGVRCLIKDRAIVKILQLQVT